MWENPDFKPNDIPEETAPHAAKIEKPAGIRDSRPETAADKPTPAESHKKRAPRDLRPETELNRRNIISIDHFIGIGQAVEKIDEIRSANPSGGFAELKLIMAKHALTPEDVDITAQELEDEKLAEPKTDRK